MALAGSALFLGVAYLVALFAAASFGDRRADQGRSLIASPYVYTLSLAVYCTAWTFYGSVGVAATQGLGFLPIYLGPTLVAILFPFLLRKILTITKANGITSIADFISARYGKSGLLGGLVTVVAVVGSVPYIALQLKAVGLSVEVMLGAGPAASGSPAIGTDTVFLVTIVLAAFSILFGTRHIDATEHHQGMVLAVALESVVKLLCFLVVGVVVTFVLFDGPAAIFRRAAEQGLGSLASIGAPGGSYADFFLTTLLAGAAFLVLPRQFQVAVIENVESDHIRRASWLLPLYLLVINLFVLPIALAGRIAGLNPAEADLFVLTLPLSAGRDWLALVAFLGGLSAATAMVIVETVALSTMISNDLVMPVLLRLGFLRLHRRHDLQAVVLLIRRLGILIVLLAGYAFFEVVGGRYGLASIGLISFTAVAQLGPPILAGIYWRDANRSGAILGLLAGFVVWILTLVVPAFAEARSAGPPDIVTHGYLGIALLKPYALFGLSGLQPVSHAVIWSLGTNIVCLVACSLLGRQSRLEQIQTRLYVDAGQEQLGARLWRGEARVGALRDLLRRFLGRHRADAALALDAARRGRALAPEERADGVLVELCERHIARAIGAASARAVVGSVVRGEVIGPDDLMEILNETSQVLEYSRQLEQKSQALEAATAELRRANERLRHLDQLKDDFIATVSHELRTPLTAIRSFSEILLDTPDLDRGEREEFLEIVVRESERLTRLINDLLDIAKIESGRMEWHVGECDLKDIVEQAVDATHSLLAERRIALETAMGATSAPVSCDRDRLVQVVINLVSNAAKFVPDEGGHVRLALLQRAGELEVRVEDNGPGVPESAREAVFEKFRQLADDLKSRPKGTGLGLTICRQIIERFGGRIWVERSSLGGAAFCFTLPVAQASPAAAAA